MNMKTTMLINMSSCTGKRARTVIRTIRINILEVNIRKDKRASIDITERMKGN